MKSTQPVSRRRRKRLRPAPASDSQDKVNQSKVSSSSFDDTELHFLDNSGDFLSDREATLASIPMLLAERQTRLPRKRPQTWQREVMQTFVKKPEGRGKSHRQWRDFSRREIPFTKLGTPMSDAVLGMDRRGSYVVCLGAQGCRKTPLALAIRIYGIPSPACQGKSGRAQLLQTSPLLYELKDETPEETIFSFHRGISPASTPVKILISNDWRIGVALFQPSNLWRDSQILGTLVIFSLHQRDCIEQVTSTYKCTNVTIRTKDVFNRRNLLWNVSSQPLVQQGMSSSAEIQCSNFPGYLVLNDENDGFRLTWLVDGWSGFMHSDHPKDDSNSSKMGNATDSSRCIISWENSWERIDADIRSGEIRSNPVKGAPTNGLTVCCESFLHVDCILHDILDRRKGIKETCPNYSYNLVSVASTGRKARLIITFLRSQKPGALGVFVEVDLFVGKFEELEWVKSTQVLDSPSLRKWSDTLAINRRMKDCRIGPYAVKATHQIDWSGLCVERQYDRDEDDNFDSRLWRNYLDSRIVDENVKAPKCISFGSLYPHCDYLSNKAIIDCSPVKSLQGKDSPTQLIYG